MARLWGAGRIKSLLGFVVGTAVGVAKNTPQGQMVMKGLATAKAVRRAASDPKSIVKPPERKSADIDTLRGLYEFHSDGDVLIKSDGETYVWVTGNGHGGNWVHNSAIEIED